MSAPQDGGPAFPFVEPMTYSHVFTGMTLRDWFAGETLAGLLNGESDRKLFLHEGETFADAMRRVAAGRAKLACIQADAMLAERAKGGGQ